MRGVNDLHFFVARQKMKNMSQSEKGSPASHIKSLEERQKVTIFPASFIMSIKF